MNKKRSSVIEWAIHNPVTMNIIMVIVLCLGFFSMKTIHREMWPSLLAERISIHVSLKERSTPELVDKNIVSVMYPKIRDIEGIQKITSQAKSSYASFDLNLEDGANLQEVLVDVKNATDAISNLPSIVDSIHVDDVKMQEYPIHLVISGQTQSKKALLETAMRVQKDIKNKGLANTIYIYPHPTPTLTIYAPEDILKSKGLTLQTLSQQIKAATEESSLGQISVADKQIMLKGAARKTQREDFFTIPIQLANGAVLPLKQIIGEENIVDSLFNEDPPSLILNGQDSIVLGIAKSKKDDTITLCKNIRSYVEELSLSGDIQVKAMWDMSTHVQDRLDLISSNGFIGLILVIIILSLFLEWRIAFWAAAGIAFSLIGSLYVMDSTDHSINMISLFGFLITLGIIVDDAIVVGENFFHYKQKGYSAKEAAVRSLSEIKWPVIAMVSTTIVAFIPLLYVSGSSGRFIAILPLSIISALALSLFEALLILPGHLAHHCGDKPSFLMKTLYFCFSPFIKLSRYLQGYINQYLELFLAKIFQPFIRWCLHHRYAVLSYFTGIAILIFTLIPTGAVKLTFFPAPEQDNAQIPYEFEQGMSVKRSVKELLPLTKAIEHCNAYFIERDGKTPLKDSFMVVGSSASHTGFLHLAFYSSKEGREVTTNEYISKLRELTPPIPHLVSLDFLGAASSAKNGKPISVSLISDNDEELSLAKSKVINFLHQQQDVIDIDTNLKQAIDTLSFKQEDFNGTRPFSERELLASLREKYQGIWLDTFFRNDQEIDVYVKSPLKERESLFLLKNHSLPSDLTIAQAAQMVRIKENQTINRKQGERSVRVSAEIDTHAKRQASEIRNILETQILHSLKSEFPSVKWSWSGEAEDGNETVDSILKTLVPTFLAIYLILATIFRSYWQPLLIMFAIPFGILGAILGHWIMGLPLSLMSAFGLLALTGVVINDSLVLIDCINKLIKEGYSLHEALVLSCQRRFRPIMLTTVTTILGMVTVLFETSLQAQFLLPMVNVLVFGIGISTALILFIIPCCYAIIYDVFSLFYRLKTGKWPSDIACLLPQH